MGNQLNCEGRNRMRPTINHKKKKQKILFRKNKQKTNKKLNNNPATKKQKQKSFRQTNKKTNREPPCADPQPAESPASLRRGERRIEPCPIRAKKCGGDQRPATRANA